MNRELDIRNFEQFMAQQFDAEQGADLRKIICKEFKQRNSAIKKACHGNDKIGIRDEAHGIKGTASTFQLEELANFAAKIESVANVDTNKTLDDALIQHIAVIETQLHYYVRDLEAGTELAEG